MELRGHRFGNADRARRAILGPSGHADIAISDHSDDSFAAFVDHRNRTAVAIPHELRCDAERFVSANASNVPRHHVFDFHGSTSRGGATIVLLEVPLDNEANGTHGSSGCGTILQMRP